MKQLLLAGSFAFAVTLVYGWAGNSNQLTGKETSSYQSVVDTTPKLDTGKHKKWGKDSSHHRDSLRPVPDTTKP